MLKVNNLPEYAKNYNWLACNTVDDELWFYGAYNDHDKAFDVAISIGGVVVLSTSVAM